MARSGLPRKRALLTKLRKYHSPSCLDPEDGCLSISTPARSSAVCVEFRDAPAERGLIVQQG
jgi:hypothetical protein